MRLRTALHYLLPVLILGSPFYAQTKDAPSHARPYFMPSGERQRIRSLVKKEAWAKAEHERIQKQAGK